MKKLLITIATCLFNFYGFNQTHADRLNELLTAYSKQDKFNGTALVAQKGKIMLKKGYGFKDATSHALNDSSTIYQIGSVTKQFTAALILRLQEQGKLSVKDKLSKYFADFPKGDQITIEHLLTHTSGIYNYTNDHNFMLNEITNAYNREKLVALFKDKPLDFEPGTKWSYSNSGYLLLGYIIEKVTGKPYESVMREMILQPLQMTHSGFDFTHLTSPDKAIGYMVLNNEAGTIAPVVDSSISFSAGALYSTVDDLYKWERGIYNTDILKMDSWKAAQTPYKNKYGYGWLIDTLYGKLIHTHGGGIHGFNSNLLRIPGEEIVIILLNNKSNPFLSEITKGITAVLLDQPYKLPEAPLEVTLPDSILQRYVGVYELAPNFLITITLNNSSLNAQATGQPSAAIYPRKENFFFYKVVDAQIEFITMADGKTDKLILYQNGNKIEGKKK